MFPLLLAAVAVTDSEALLQLIADSQEKALEARKTIVYRQEIHAKLIRANGELARQERYVYQVTPTPAGTEKKLVEFEGSYAKDGKMIPYSAPGFEHKGVDIDAELIKDLVDDLVSDESSRDGIASDLFPLTAAEQKKYRFRIAGNRLEFEPSGKSTPWRGEMEVNPADGQPRSVVTKMARRVPAWARITLGTNFQQVGFSVKYQRAVDELWFPVSYGTEFKFRVLFGYARTFTLSVVNSDFRKASAESTIRYEEVEP
jgi:hypothetical protein